MHVFVTGGTGFVGGRVVTELLAAGHDVLALARSARSAAALARAGATPHPGSLEDLDAVREAVRRCDAVAHTAFNNSNPWRFRQTAAREREALAVMAAELRGSGRPLLAAGGFAPVVAAGPLLTEQDGVKPGAGLSGRNVERTIMRLADGGVRAGVVRLPCVHGDGDRFTMPHLIELARRRGYAGYAGDGDNRIAAVHADDAARVFVRALERVEPGERFDAVGEQAIRYREVAVAIARGLGTPSRSVPRWRVLAAFGTYAGFVSGDRPASSQLTQRRLDWDPTGPGLLEDLARPEYFTA